MSSVRTSVLNFTFGLLLNHIRDVTSNINVLCCVGRVGLSDEGPILESIDYTIRIGSTPTFLYFDLCPLFSLVSRTIVPRIVQIAANNAQVHDQGNILFLNQVYQDISN